MHDLNEILKQNELAETMKSQALARAMNAPACKRCAGAGRVLRVSPDMRKRFPVAAVKCPDCTP